jgi:hypothetical protein
MPGCLLDSLGMDDVRSVAYALLRMAWQAPERGGLMLGVLGWVWRRLRGGTASLPPLPDGAETAPCPRCDGSGQCRVCEGRGTVDRLVAVAGADGGGIMAEPPQQLKTMKCRACRGSSGTCKVCEGRGRIVVSPPE